MVNQEDKTVILPSGEIEFQYGPGGNPPPHYPGGGSAIPVPDDSDSSSELIPDGAYGPSPDDDHPAVSYGSSHGASSSRRTSRCTRSNTTIC